MGNHEEDTFRLLLPGGVRAAFLDAVAAAAAEDGKDLPAFREEVVPADEARALKFDPITLGALGLVALKFGGSAVAGHLVCKAFDKLFASKPQAPQVIVVPQIIVIDPEGRKYPVTAENLTVLSRVLIRQAPM